MAKQEKKCSQGHLVLDLLEWYRTHARELPWRENPPNPYHVWLSEIMLQQTRIEAVRQAYARILETCPTVERLAALPEESLLKLWQGLGYYSRARNLHAAAKFIAGQGRFPEDGDHWRALPGVGEYTAGAISSIVLGERRPAVDGNVLRVLSRLRGENLDRPEATELLRSWMPATETGLFTQAWMELGEVVCIPHGEPHCDECPFREECVARHQGRINDLPAPSAKKPRPVQELTVFRLQTVDGYTALRQRPSTGLLAKMWEFPHVDGTLTVRDIRGLLADWGVRVQSLRRVCSSVHLFTHREWRMENYAATVAACAGDFTWATQEELRTRYAIPSAFSALM